jgi:hypothetical protein
VIQTRGGFSFAAKPFEGLVIVSEIVGKKLKRHKAVEAGVLSLVDDTHSRTPSSRRCDNAK